jgi:hypothetical protein
VINFRGINLPTFIAASSDQPVDGQEKYHWILGKRMYILPVLVGEFLMNTFLKLAVACVICIGVITGLVLLVEGMQ